MSETTSKGDRMLAGLGALKPAGETDLQGSKPASNAVAESGHAGENANWDETLLEQVSRQMAARQMETQRLREAMLAVGVSEELVDDPEGAEMEHLEEDEQEQFNDAVREHRAFRQELEHDMRELQYSRDAVGTRHEEATMPPPTTRTEA